MHKTNEGQVPIFTNETSKSELVIISSLWILLLMAIITPPPRLL